MWAWLRKKIFVPGTLCLSFTKQIFSLFSLCSFLDLSIEPGVKKEGKQMHHKVLIGIAQACVEVIL